MSPTKKKTTARKFELFECLTEVATKNKSYYESLSEEEIKGFPPVVVMRWLSGTSNLGQILLTNEVLNKFVFSLYKHKALLYRLMTIVGTGKFQKFNWIKSKTSTTISVPLCVQVIQQFFGYSKKQATESVSLITPDNLIKMAEEMGWQDEEIDKLKKEVGISAPKKRSKKPRNK